MEGFSLIGRMFIVIGIIIILMGCILIFASKFSWIGRLPGDITIKKGHFIFAFPIVTCIIISIIVTLILYLLRR